MLLIALLLKGFSGCTSQYKLSVSTLYYLYLNVYKTKEREKRAVEITLHGNCSSLLGCRAGRLDLTTVVSQLHVLSNILTHNAWLHNSKSLLNY